MAPRDRQLRYDPVWVDGNGFTRRSGSFKIKGIIVHAIGEFVGDGAQAPTYPAWEYLYRTKQKLGAHAFVTPSGVVVRSVPDRLMCWHARGFNRDHLGIEIMVPGVYEGGDGFLRFLERIEGPWVGRHQLDAAVMLTHRWRANYGLSLGDVKRHSDVDPDRKQDPGKGFPWAQFQDRLADLSA